MSLNVWSWVTQVAYPPLHSVASMNSCRQLSARLRVWLQRPGFAAAQIESQLHQTEHASQGPRPCHMCTRSDMSSALKQRQRSRACTTTDQSWSEQPGEPVLRGQSRRARNRLALTPMKLFTVALNFPTSFALENASEAKWPHCCGGSHFRHSPGARQSSTTF